MTDQKPFEIDVSSKPEVIHFFDKATSTFSCIVKDSTSNVSAVMDSVMDLDYAAGRITHDSADRIVSYIRDSNWRINGLLRLMYTQIIFRLLLTSSKKWVAR